MYLISFSDIFSSVSSIYSIVTLFVLYNVTNGIFCITFPNEIFNSFV